VSADEPTVARAIDRAFARLDALGGDPTRLEPPLRTLVLVVSAQGVIENGGLAHFLGNDWPGQPPYARFVEAFREIGATRAAAVLEEAVGAFDFPHPERDVERRRRALSGALGARLQALDVLWPGPADEGAEEGADEVEAGLAAFVGRGGAGDGTGPG